MDCSGALLQCAHSCAARPSGMPPSDSAAASHGLTHAHWLMPPLSSPQRPASQPFRGWHTLPGLPAAAPLGYPAAPPSLCTPPAWATPAEGGWGLLRQSRAHRPETFRPLFAGFKGAFLRRSLPWCGGLLHRKAVQGGRARVEAGEWWRWQHASQARPPTAPPLPTPALAPPPPPLSTPALALPPACLLHPPRTLPRNWLCTCALYRRAPTHL